MTTSVRSTQASSIQISQGQSIALLDGKPVSAAASHHDALLQALNKACTQGIEVVTIYYGAGVSGQGAQTMAESVRQALPSVEVELIDGGQPHYSYIVSLE